MKILTLNSGSSSLKCALYDVTSATSASLLAKKEILFSSALSIKKSLEPFLVDNLDGIGHRIVHGKDLFTEGTLITPQVKKELYSLTSLSPLHTTKELKLVEEVEALLPKIPQVAVFDTSFHHTLPKVAKMYPLPYELYEEGIKRYGFHGINYQYCAKKVASLLGGVPKRHVICHLGSGSSLCAIQNGISIDTTMGFTPLEGAMMGTRSGSIDPGILLFLLKEKKLSFQELSKLLYEKSGLLGVSGDTSDMRSLVNKMGKGDERAKIAFNLYSHRVIQLLGSMIASLGGIDVLTFTGGIGENTPLLREIVCKQFNFLPLILNKEVNKTAGKENTLLSTENSEVRIYLIPADEELEIALTSAKLLKFP